MNNHFFHNLKHGLVIVVADRGCQRPSVLSSLLYIREGGSEVRDLAVFNIAANSPLSVDQKLELYRN